MNIESNSIYVKGLKVFEAIKEAVTSNMQLNLENFAFICVQHELSTIINLFESLIQFGAKPDNIFLTGKHYSTCEAVGLTLSAMGIQRQAGFPQSKLGEFESVFKKGISHLWASFLKSTSAKKIKGVIVLDDGGRCLASTPREVISEYPIVGIEQTTGGLMNPDTFNLPFPVIEVASSAAKLWLESPIIANAAVTQQIDSLLKQTATNKICGIVGAGFVGRAVTQRLVNLGYKVILYDKQEIKINPHPNISESKTLEELFERSQYIFGCTGYDITRTIDLDWLTEDKLLLSCSSEDREFLSLIQPINYKSIEKYYPLNNISYKTSKGANLNILRGGFPITFDGSSQPAPAKDIQLTQGLLLGALLQASAILPHNAMQNCKARLMLDPAVQQFVASVWLSEQPAEITKQFGAYFQDTAWIKSRSGGNYQTCDYINSCFGN